MSSFENFKERLLTKKRFYIMLAGKKYKEKKHENVAPKVWDRFETKK